MSRFTELDIDRVPLTETTLIEASAGTGKTYTIAALVLRLILEADMDIRNLLVVTFTEAATSELRDRIWNNLVQALGWCRDPSAGGDPMVGRLLKRNIHNEAAARRLQRALVCFDESSIFTIHGFCRRMLSHHAFESALRFDAELITDQAHYVEEVIDDFRRLTFSRATPLEWAAAAVGGLDLDRLARTFVDKPTLAMVPEDPGQANRDLADSYAAVAAAWQADGDTVRDILSTDERFSRGEKNGFRADVLEAHLATLTAMLAGRPDPEGLAVLEMFTPQGLRQRTKPSRRQEGVPEHPFFSACRDLSLARQDFLTHLKHRFKDFLESELQARKQAGRVQYFSDLLTDLRRALAADPGGALEKAIREQYRAVLIDEFQDTDPVQYDIFQRLFARAGQGLFFIGDPKQSIYAFRSADIFSYLEAAAGVPDARRLTLADNWRSETALVEAVNHLFAGTVNPFVLGEEIPFHPVRAAAENTGNRHPLLLDGAAAGGLDILAVVDPDGNDDRKYIRKEEARAAAVGTVAHEIADLLAMSRQGRARLGDRPLVPSDMAVLVTRNEDAGRIKDRLAALQIPAVVSRTGDVFQSDDALELEQVLLAVVSPGHVRRLNTALATDMLGLTAADIRFLLEEEAGAAAHEAHLERFAGFNELWRQGGFMRMFRRLLADYNVRERLLSLPDGERRLTNLLHLAELVHRAAREQRLDMNGVTRWLNEQRVKPGTEEESQLRLERDGQAVQILTVWKSKGLQYPIIFCPFMWQQGARLRPAEDVIFHAGNRVWMDIGSGRPENRRQAEQERLAELMRLLYVALTRAVNRCYLVAGRIGRQPAVTALDYLFAGGSPPAEDLVAVTLERIAAETEATLYERIRARIAPAGPFIRLQPCGETSSPPALAEDSGPAASLRAAEFGGRIDQGWSLGSFTRLVAGQAAIATEDDHGGRELERTLPATGQAAEPADGFFAFPAGAGPGLCIHAIFEQLDFAGADREEIRCLVQSVLRRYDLETGAPGGGTWTPVVCGMIDRVCRAPLAGADCQFRLGRVPPEHVLAEMAFYYPIRRLTPADLQAVFQQAAGGAEAASYAGQVGRLKFSPFHGYMRGFIDLVCRHDGRYYLLDWKTNHLGNTYWDYDPERLARVMVESHYCLQYHIYALALHRHLAARLPDYDYQGHFGGVFYLFVRGVHPDWPGHGIYFDRPAPSLMAALNEMVGPA
ncbi:MAG: exodeoxyribonuclease V subunit beta [Desulfosudaceae bacterium]